MALRSMGPPYRNTAAMPNRHSATHKGFTFYRTSQSRRYTHVVLTQGSLAADRADCERNSRDYFARNLAYYRELASGVHKLAAQYPTHYTAEAIADDVAKAQAWVAKGVEGHVAEDLARFDARAVNWKTLDDGDTYFSSVGWCGSEALARKSASACGGFIVPAVVS